MAFLLSSRAALTSAAGRRARPGRVSSVVVELLLPVVLLAAWWLLSRNSTSLYFPPLSGILEAFRQNWLFAGFTSDALPSLANLAVGYVLSCAVGIGLGVALGSSRRLAAALSPLLECLRAVPGVALLPAALLLLGPGDGMRISVIVFGAIWPILLNTIDGVTGVDPVVLDVARSYRIGTFSRLVRITLPAAGPRIVAGMRTAISIAITLIVFSEMFGSTQGIGFQLLATERGFDIPGLWAAMILLGVLGYVVNVAFRIFERIVLRWQYTMNRKSES